MRLFNRLRAGAILAVAAAAVPFAVHAQEGSPTFRADTRLVVLHASVADSRADC